MYYKNQITDPQGAMRLIKNGCKEYLSKETLPLYSPKFAKIFEITDSESIV